MKKTKPIPKLNMKTFFLFASLLLPAVSLLAQVSISGKVTDSKNNPLSGATILIKNSAIGTSSASDGTFVLTTNLKIGQHAILFSSVGYKTQEETITVSGSKAFTFNINLSEDISGLDEVVVTGTSLGTTRKQLGNYVTTVKGSSLANAATSNAIAALQGKIAGAQIIQNSGDPAGGMTVRLRGISTIGSSSEPLYIVDGVIINNSNARVTNTTDTYDAAGAVGQNRMIDINPNDIDRIEVLNGAAASAIYGSRANAGVVQIFTKRGSSGAPQVSFSTSIKSNSLRKRLVFNRAPTKFGGSPDVQTQDILTPALTNTTPVTRYDYQDDIFRTGIGTDNNVSVTGGREKFKYYASANFGYNEGIVKNTDNRRYGFRLNFDQSLNNWLTINGGINYVYNATNEKPDGNSFYSPLNVMTILGNFHDIRTRDANGNIKAVGERGRINPLSVIEDLKQKQSTSRTISNLGLKMNVTKGLNIDYMIGIDNTAQNGTTYYPPYTYNANTAFFGGGIGLDPTLNGYASSANYTGMFFNHDLNITYSTQLSNLLASTTQLGYSEQYEKTQYSLIHSRGLAPFVQTAVAGSTILPPSDVRAEQSIRGAFLQQNFKFNNQFFVTLAGRLDGSSVFAKENRNQFYPKVSASYVISDAKFFSESGIAKKVNNLKFRAAYGESGNLTGIGAYDRFNTYLSSSYLGRTSLGSFSTRANDNIVPERQKEFEIGTDLSMFNNRLLFTLNVYNKKVEDLIVPNLTIAPSTGFTSERKNVGTLTNKGFEILLTGVPVKNKNFSWDVTLNYNRNKNRIESVSAPLIQFTSITGASFGLIPGLDAPVFYTTYFARNDKGDYLLNAAGFPQTERGNAITNLPLRDANGQPSGAVLRKATGSPNPDYTATLTNSFNYKKFNLRVQLDRVKGNEVFNADFRTRQGVGNGSEFAEKEHMGLLPRGYISNIYAIEEWRVEDGSFTKLREVSLSYNFGKLNHAFSDLTLSFAGRNLVSWDDYRGYDPETNASGQSTLLRGIDFGNVPIPKTFQLGVTAKF